MLLISPSLAPARRDARSPAGWRRGLSYGSGSSRRALTTGQEGAEGGRPISSTRITRRRATTGTSNNRARVLWEAAPRITSRRWCGRGRATSIAGKSLGGATPIWRRWSRTWRVGSNLHDHPGLGLEYQLTQRTVRATKDDARKGRFYQAQVVLRPGPELHVIPY